MKNYDGQESPILYTKFRESWPAGFGEEDFFNVTMYGHGGHLVHVTSIISTIFISLYLNDYIQNLVQNGPVVSEKSVL